MRGFCSLYGAESGILDCVRPMEDLAENGSLFATRSHLAHYMRNRAKVEQGVGNLLAVHQEGQLKFTLDSRNFDFAHVVDAHRSLEARETTGKIILKVP